MNDQKIKRPRIFTVQFILCISLLSFGLNCFAQKINSSADTTYIFCENGNKVQLSSIGKVTMYLKSGSPRSKCIITKIGNMDIEYIKDGSLHNILIENIKRIVPEKDLSKTIYFDKERKPYIQITPGYMQQKQEVLIPTETKKEIIRQGNDLLITKTGDSIFCTILRQSSMYVFYVENKISKTIVKSELSKIQSLTAVANDKVDSSKTISQGQVPNSDTNAISARTNKTRDTNGTLISIDKNSPKADTLYLRDGEKLLVKITEIGTSTITYTKNNSYQHVVSRSDAQKIVLNNGYEEIFKQTTEPEKPKKNDYYNMGLRDGDIYYNAASSMAAGAASVLLLYFGLILVGLIALIPPISLYSPSNPNNNLLSDPEYERGYMKAAHRKKARKTFGGFLIGLLIIGLLALVILAVAF